MERYPDWPNLAAMMFDRARTWSARPMLRAFRDGAWQTTTWGEFGRLAASAARHLRQAGIGPGDRVLIVSENRPEIPIIETALMAIRAVPVPAYTTYTVADHAHVLRDCGARAAVVSSAEFAGRVAQAGPLDLLVTMEPFSAPGLNVIAFDSLTGDALPPDDVSAEAALIPGGGMSCLIYTSGTGGEPKGVMTPHRAILSNCRGAFELIQMIGWTAGQEVYLSYLPLSHSYEHTVGQFFMLSIGGEVVFSRGVENLAADILAVRPTIMTMVPRVLEVIRGRILGQLTRQPGWKQALFRRAVELGEKKLDGEALSLSERVQDWVLDRMVRAKVAERFGGRMRVAISGGARLEPEVGRFFIALGVHLLQGYGQTEAGPVIAANRPDRVKIDTVGPPLTGVEVRIAEDGEILVRGDLVMDGYWGRPEETAQVIRDGWLHTGDIGEQDADGYIRITDRKKDMIVLSGGENVSPAKIEGMLMAEPAIAQAVVVGDGRAGLTALVVASEGFDDVAVAVGVTEVNQRLSVSERIRKHALVEAFTVDNGLLTPTQKIRRMLVIRANTEILAKLQR